jgi:DNA-binding XRE family transcriptional regulator
MKEEDAVDGATLKAWRKQLGFTQEEAAKQLDVTRATIQNWEHEITSLPGGINLACREYMYRWKQRPGFGPVLLVYLDGPIWPQSENANCLPLLHCEPHPDNEAAIQRALHLRSEQPLITPWILEEGENVVWNGPELQLECTRRLT